MGAVGKIIDGIFVPFGENNRQQFIGTSEEIQANIESGQLQNGDTVFNNDNNKSVGRIENDEYVPYTGGDTTVDFTESETRENIEPINPLKNILGKIRRWFSDIGDAAFANIVNNRTTTEPGFVADARQLKELQDQIDAQNSTLDNIGSAVHKIIPLKPTEILVISGNMAYLNLKLYEVTTDKENEHDFEIPPDYEPAVNTSFFVYMAYNNSNYLGLIFINDGAFNLRYMSNYGAWGRVPQGALVTGTAFWNY